jgi:regulatory protein
VSPKQDPQERAREYAFLLLKFRLRSVKELAERLKRKKFDDATIKQTLAFLREKEFIDDRVFARTWIASRIKRHLGLKRIVQELKIKGVDKEIIDSQVQEIKRDYPEEEIVRQLAKTRLEKSKHSDPRQAKRRVYAYLLRRGFLPETVSEVMSQT